MRVSFGAREIRCAAVFSFSTTRRIPPPRPTARTPPRPTTRRNKEPQPRGASAAQLLKKTTLDHVRRSHVRGIEALSKACGAQTLAGRRARGGATTPPAEQRAPRNRYLSLWRSRSRPRATRRRDRRRAAGRAAGAARPLPLFVAEPLPVLTRHAISRDSRRAAGRAVGAHRRRRGLGSRQPHVAVGVPLGGVARGRRPEPLARAARPDADHKRAGRRLPLLLDDLQPNPRCDASEDPGGVWEGSRSRNQSGTLPDAAPRPASSLSGTVDCPLPRSAAPSTAPLPAPPISLRFAARCGASLPSLKHSEALSNAAPRSCRCSRPTPRRGGPRSLSSSRPTSYRPSP